MSIPNPFFQLIHQAVKYRVETCGDEISGVSIDVLNDWQVEKYRAENKCVELCDVCKRWYGGNETGNTGVLVIDIPGIQVCMLCQIAVCELVFGYLRDE